MQQRTERDKNGNEKKILNYSKIKTLPYLLEMESKRNLLQIAVLKESI